MFTQSITENLSISTSVKYMEVSSNCAAAEANDVFFCQHNFQISAADWISFSSVGHPGRVLHCFHIDEAVEGCCFKSV